MAGVLWDENVHGDKFGHFCSYLLIDPRDVLTITHSPACVRIKSHLTETETADKPVIRVNLLSGVYQKLGAIHTKICVGPICVSPTARGPK